MIPILFWNSLQAKIVLLSTNVEKQPKTTMWQIEDAVVQATSLNFDKAPKQAWEKNNATVFDSWK